jgi:CRISPR-associated protein (TIGR03986 family)
MSEEFINPYNFVGLKDKKTLAEKPKPGERKLTGYLEVSITTKTPLIIPNTSKEQDKNEHKTFEFYTHEDLSQSVTGLKSPVIPGSEIRGVVRSIHEAMNNSCLRTDSENTGFIRKKHNGTDPDNPAPGFLVKKDDKWLLYDSVACFVCSEWTIDPSQPDKICDTKGNTCSNYQEVSFVSDLNAFTAVVDLSGSSENKGFLVVGESFGTSPTHSSKIYQINEDYCIEVSEKLVDGLRQTLQQYSDEKVNKFYDTIHHYGYKGYRLGEIPVPVYFDYNPNDNTVSYLSPAAIGKSAYQRRVSDLIPGYAPCTDKDDDCCETCSVFGFVAPSKKKGEDDENTSQGHLGHLRFTDATTNVSPMACYGPMQTLSPLLTPHISNIEFYTYCDGRNKWDYDDDGTHIRGRKFYFHHPIESKYAYDNSFKDSRFTATFRSVNPNITFTSRVYYEDLTETQLEKVIAAIDLFDDNHGQMMGHGKPFGFGSVKMKVTKNIERTILANAGKIDYVENEAVPKAYSFDNNDEAIQELKFMTDFSSTKVNGFQVSVHYPFSARTNKGFDWFTDNKLGKSGRASLNFTAYEQQLPKVCDVIKGRANITLHN